MLPHECSIHYIILIFLHTSEVCTDVMVTGKETSNMGWHVSLRKFTCKVALPVRDESTSLATLPGTEAIRAAVATYTTTGSADVLRESRFLLMAQSRGTAPSTPTGKPTTTGATLLPKREL